MRAGVAGWVFVAPALLVRGLFFALPVAAALLLSLTDFDLYALSDPSLLRFVALDNYLE
ncbi:MAG: sugar ABC transporter permease, partial [Gammaproteobacteria bacterium]|nr:sugar ABC transporter permease [Gammaproteobacteria bacterium]